MKKTTKFWLTIGIISLVTPTIVAGGYFSLLKIRDNVTEDYSNLIDDVINNNSNNININNSFIKGADVSSYAYIIENFLFERNIKKSENEYYTYKDIQDENNKIWDDSVNDNVSLYQYINNNLFSYIDSNSNRVYANMFEILHNKGINSLRLRLWVDPYDENGNLYGGGHNDLETTIFIINEAKKYGFNDFLLSMHYSDFWADPGRQYIPKSWMNLSEEELIQKGYDYTYATLNEIYERTGIIINRIQYGNEITYGMLWPNGTYRPQNYYFSNKFILSAIKATELFESEHNVHIDKAIHFSNMSPLRITKLINHYEQSIKYVDTIYISSYVVYHHTFNKLYNVLKVLKDNCPNKKIIIGEVAVPYTSQDYGYINDASSGVVNENKPDYFEYSPEIQSLITYQYMQLMSKLFPNIETGMYWWEVGYLYTGRAAWSTKAGLDYLSSMDMRNREFEDVNNWSTLTCFDRNGIALPVMDVINNFSRTIDNTYNIFNPNDIVDIYDNESSPKNVFYKEINFAYPKNATKYNLANICYDKNNQNASNKIYDCEIHLNKYDYQDYLNMYTFDQILENIVILELQNEFDSIMYDQVVFDNFKYDNYSSTGEITISAKPNSFYYYGSITFKFKLHDSYYANTIDLSNQVININRNSNTWYHDIINVLKSQPDYAFGKQIYDYLNVSGGATDNNDIWLYDSDKQVNRNPEFFLLYNDQIRLYDGTVDVNILNSNKYWLNNFSELNNQNINTIYFGIRKAINSIDYTYNTPSTFQQVGKESWQKVDLLIYKLSINIVD